MYTASDPRSTLAGSGSKPEAGWVHTSFFGSQLALFYGTEPQVSDAGGETWIARGQNFVLAYSKAVAGGSFVRSAQPDEYAVIIPDAETQVEVTTAAGAEVVPGYSVVFVPPGDSSILMLTQEGRVLASLGLTYFKSAFASELEACQRFAPILQSAAVAISDDLGRLSRNMSVDVSEFGSIP